ncbi:MAG: pyroglutamyl-peptidase I [Herpetosiphon sp.]
MQSVTMKLLLTGFEPFDGRDTNSSERAVHALKEQRWNGVDVHPVILPVDSELGPATLLEAFERVRPQMVLCLGEAKGRMRVSVERVAVNLLDYGIADNSGKQLQDIPIVANAPVAYFSTLPVREMVATLVEANVPAELSLSAGAFLCNQVSYVLLHYLAQTGQQCPAGFIHLPLLSSQAAREQKPVPSLSLDVIRHGLAAVIQSLADMARTV